MSKLHLTFRPFSAGDEAAFRELNEAWIQQLFALEAKDIEILRDPVMHILDRGGHILMAVQGEAAVGCCALIRRGENSFELGKMAVKESFRGAGIGKGLLLYVVEYARYLKAQSLYLETSHKLPNAIHLYESAGFTYVPKERIEPSPYARSDIHMEMNLAQ